MVTAKTQYNLKNAQEYFEEHLCVGDYYNEGQRVAGEWAGLGAERLALSGKVRAADFLRLCENQNPSTGDTLTQRVNTTRTEDGENAANRRIFYDFTFSPPKSVSLAGFLGKDERIIEAHARAVRAAVREFEAFAGTRIRTNGAQSDRLTGNFTAALFTHDTSRTLDPHLHTHCIVFNATFDSVENRWKALQNYELLRARKFAENAYYHELARELRSFGYRIRNRARGDFQIEGVSDELCERFSKRHAEIDKALAKLLEEKPEIADGDMMATRRLIATAERARKQRDLSRTELHELWESQLTRDEREAISGLHNQSAQSPSDGKRMSLGDAVQWAEEHLFDRNSVVLECQVWQEALGRARGESFPVSELTDFTRQRGYIRDEARPGEVTMREVLLREWEIVQTAKEGVAACHPLVANPRPVRATLDDEQRKALDALLSSTNAVSVFRGGAGTGKSFVLCELVEQLHQSGRRVVVLAPQRQQVVDMEKAGLPSPSTVANFLLKRELAIGAVVVVDEAGQIGGRQMLELLRLARDRNARVILSGDTRQHGAVEASDALLAIERHSGVKPVELRKIRRQDPALGRDYDERKQIKQYRKAVESAAGGKVGESFECLNKMGAVVACGLGDQADKLADEYLRLTERDASAVVVSQTWAEVHRVNSRVRDALKANGLLGANDSTVQVLDRLDLTNAQKRDERFYPKDAVVVFNQKIREAEPGAKGKLTGIVKAGVLVEVGGRFVTVSNKMLDRISVCLPRECLVTAGDRLHLKANRKLATGGRVTNGELVAVKSIRADGGIELMDGRVLDKEFREFLPGYAVTSYGSQGKTVDYVLFSDSTIKAATNTQQWYVTISRGRRGIRIFTPDKEQLRENVTRSGHRRLARPCARILKTALAAKTDFAASSFMYGLMENNADAGLIVRSDQQLTDEQQEQICATLRNRRCSPGALNRSLFLWGANEVLAPRLSSADLQFLENRKLSRTEICSAFGVPEEIVTTTDHNKYDVMRGARLNFIENRIAPLCARLEAEENCTTIPALLATIENQNSKIQNPFCTLHSSFFIGGGARGEGSIENQNSKIKNSVVGWFDLDALPIMQQARRERLVAAKTGFDMGIPFNELNRILDLGFKPLPWGDVGYLPSKYQPLQSASATAQNIRSEPSAASLSRDCKEPRSEASNSSPPSTDTAVVRAEETAVHAQETAVPAEQTQPIENRKSKIKNHPDTLQLARELRDLVRSTTSAPLPPQTLKQSQT